MDRVAEGSEMYQVAPLLNYIQDGEVGNSCLPFVSMNRLKVAIVGLIVGLNSS